MARYSSDSDSSSVRSRSRRRRSSSSSEHRKGRSVYKSKHSSSRHSRTHKTSRHRGRSSRSNDRSKRSRRSHSRERSKKKSDRSRRRSPSREKYSKSRKRSSSGSSSSESGGRSRSKSRKSDKGESSGNSLRSKLLQTLKNAGRSEEANKPNFNIAESVIKFDLDAIQEIETDSFVPKTFKSSKNGVTVTPEPSIKTEVVNEGCPNPPPASFVADDSQIKLDRWVKKLYNIRQKALNGDVF